MLFTNAFKMDLIALLDGVITVIPNNIDRFLKTT